MPEAVIRRVAAEFQRVVRRHGPLVEFLRLTLDDGRCVTIWADGRLTMQPPADAAPSGRRLTLCRD